MVLTATPNPGYHFVQWNDGNTENPRTIIITQDTLFIANFASVTGIKNNSIEPALVLYPNPTSGKITLSDPTVQKIEVLDGVGRLVATYVHTYESDLSDLVSGSYMLRITTPHGVTIRKIWKH